MRKMRVGLGAVVAVMCISAALAASDAVIRGVVTDSAGKPIRGALVKATADFKTITRFSQKDGRYEIRVPAGNYAVTVEAYGFASKRQSKDTAQAGETNFSLSPRWDVTGLNGAELESLLPDNAESRRVKAMCIQCHNLERVLLRRGSTALEWRNFLPLMNLGRLHNQTNPTTNPNMGEPEFAALTDALGKYFGPDSPYFAPDADPPARDQVKHADLSDAALRATIREYKVPTPMPIVHSMTVDPVRGYAWFGEQRWGANKIGRFDMATETFVEYPLETPKTEAHTGVVAKDGRYFITLPDGGDAKLASVDPATGKVTEYKWPGKRGGAHTVMLDKTETIWISGGASGELWTFDIKTEQFGTHKFTVPPKYPEDSILNWQRGPGQPLPPVRATSYHIGLDSKGKAWFTVLTMGAVLSLDTVTGETKVYKPPVETPSVRGMVVDANDNVWFSSFHGHKLGKLDTKTGAMKMYQAPTQNACVYGLVMDEKRGYVWYADLNGNNITRFDPKTEQFVEYPIPTREAIARFIDLDAKGRVWFTELMGGKIGVLDPGESSN